MTASDDTTSSTGTGVSNLADLLTQAATESPDRTALVEATSGRRLTWSELDAEVSQVADGLSGMGLVAGYRVVVAVGNRVEFVTSYLGALRARMVVVPVNPRSATGELVRMIADCGARVVIADPTTVTSVRAAVAGLADALEGADDELRARSAVPRIVVAGAPTVPGETPYADLVQHGTVAEIPTPHDPEALAVLLYTSGTSGRPRAAMLSHRALLANIEQAAAVEPPMVTGDDVLLGVLPLFHVYGLNAVLGQTLRHRAALVLVDGFDVQGSLDIIEDEAVSVVPVAPSVFAHWRSVEDLADRLGGVRLVLSGSAPLAPELVESFTARTGIAVHQGYGLTEGAPVVTSTLCSAAAKPGSVGAALPGISLRLVDEDGKPPEGADPGEIQVRGANLFSGYWPDGADGPDDTGWWATGDVGFLDADGDLFLVDRLKELVIVSGFNVYPSEVEDVVSEVDGVAEAAVIGTEDEATGEAVVAYVKPAPDSSWTEQELVDAVRDHCATRLARFKQPSAVHVVDELPHTVTGKVAKGRLRATERRRGLGLLE
ncbi:MAG TPA: AMP-binding protein [Nocardioidaceae bacterium]|nr:AMP-binding protein [Nocardioidaceae bacterium]